jgi:PqqD family protein of HPr-rel-A system
MDCGYDQSLPQRPGFNILTSMEVPPRLRFWDDQCVVYDPRSGDTHLLNFLAGRILLCANHEGFEPEDVIARIAIETGLKPDQEFRTGVEIVLNELKTKGLLKHSCLSLN